MSKLRDIQYEWASWFNRIRPMPKWDCNPLPRWSWSSYRYIIRLTWLYLFGPSTPKAKPLSPSAIIARSYFETHPERKSEVVKAAYAYGLGLETSDAHNFDTEERTSRCKWCSRSREEVRWDDNVPQCEVRPSVEDIIKSEEEKAWKLFGSAGQIVPKVIKKRGLSEETFAFLHDTHGIDRETAEGALS